MAQASRPGERTRTRVVLIGMMGAGKSTVGRALAEALGWPLLDNDALVRAGAGRDGADLFDADGEPALHGAEHDAFRAAMSAATPAVVTAAASVIDDPTLRAALRTAGHVVWLRARVATLHRRVALGSGRRADAVDVAWLAARAAEREPLYRSIADQVIDVDDLDPAVIADAILAASGIPSAG